MFLNIPYDAQFQPLYLAYVAGLTALGLVPRMSVEIVGGKRRLSRVIEMIRTCRFSIHDLSRVEVDRNEPPTPRFNMPFELGLAVGWADLFPDRHTWFVSETQHRRSQKSLSDLDGTDFQIHGGTVDGVMRELCNCFVSVGRSTDVPAMMRCHTALSQLVPELTEKAGSQSLYEARVFHDLRFAATAFARNFRLGHSSAVLP